MLSRLNKLNRLPRSSSSRLRGQDDFDERLADESTPAAPQRRKRRRSTATPPASPPSTPLVKPTELEEGAPAEEQVEYLKQLAEFTKSQHDAEVVKLRTAKANAQKRSSKRKARLKKKKEELKETTDKLEKDISDLEARLQPPDPEQPLRGQKIEFKPKRKLPNEFRDLVVDLQVVQGYPAHTVVGTVAKVFTAAGATVLNAPTSRELPTRCLVERDIILFDDQCRRMAEASRLALGIAGEREIRTEDWDKEEKARRQAQEKVDVSCYEDSVAAEIKDWRIKIDYKSDRDLPAPDSVAVAEEAEVEAEYKEAACGMMNGAVDGTTHGRCVPGSRRQAAGRQQAACRAQR